MVRDEASVSLRARITFVYKGVLTLALSRCADDLITLTRNPVKCTRPLTTAYDALVTVTTL